MGTKANNSLIIVESPTKAKTIKKFLTSGYEVIASMGHVRDLPKSQLGVDIENHFEPKYIVIKGKNKIIKELKSAAKGKQIYLATDPDREGEAIAWHLSQILELGDKAKRIELHEITKKALLHALDDAKTLDEHKVDAQQARRVLDRLVGYKLSPLLWKKVKAGLSAGRVQSVAVKVICDREREISAFTPVEYWSITALLEKDGVVFPAQLSKIDGEKAEIKNESESKAILAELDGKSFIVSAVTEKEQRRNAPAPFITSSLQQEASKKLGFRVYRTMSVAQQLYEGLEIGDEGSIGLITYMRTDSPRIAPEAQAEAQEFITKRYGSDYWLGRQFKVKDAAQDAHEGIRPASVYRTPEDVKPYLNKDQFRLYELIWNRFVASQMTPAVFDVKTVEIKAGEKYDFRTSGSTMKFAGFLAVYQETEEDDAKAAEAEEKLPSADDKEKVKLPALAKDDGLRLEKLEPKQHFTQPPPRFTEASLVKTLEEKGIGRPSTYAPIIETIQYRKYVLMENKHFIPTELGFVVTDMLQINFSNILNVDFTAEMENRLDRIEEGKLGWESVITDFYSPFEGALETASKELVRVKMEPQKIGEACAQCGKDLVIKDGRFGQFIACSGYPECKYTRAMSKAIGVHCPNPGCEGEVVQLKTKKGKPFFGCIKFPACEFRSWNKPTKEVCQTCGSMMVEKAKKGEGKVLFCSKEGCNTEAPLPSAASASA